MGLAGVVTQQLQGTCMVLVFQAAPKRLSVDALVCFTQSAARFHGLLELIRSDFAAMQAERAECIGI